MNLDDKIAGAIWGHLIGDACGVPYEFHKPEEVPSLDQIEMIPPQGFLRAHEGTPTGTWSDDGSTMLCLLESLQVENKLNLSSVLGKMSKWAREGHLAIDNKVFDIGITTSHAINSFNRRISPSHCGESHEKSNGNGSLMRVLPLALWHMGTDKQLVFDAMIQSKITHAHIRSQLCCALYVLWARYSLEQDAEKSWNTAVSVMRELLAPDSIARKELEEHIKPDEAPHGTGTGYVVDCLHSARLAVSYGSYENVIKYAISLGNDTDTTACVAGGIAGIINGISSIPQRWFNHLRGKEMVYPLLEKFLQSRNEIKI